jgi:HAD superfamily hydrolase (TIGR01549 family)
MSTKLVIFDLDGVLLDSRDIWFLAWKESFKTVGLDVSYKEFIESFWGSSFDQVCARLGVVNERFEKARKNIRESFISHSGKVVAFDGIPSLFSTLEQKGIKRALLTNNDKNVVNKMLAKFGFSFDYVPDVHILKPKPDPAGIYAILEKLGMKKEDAIYVGDTDTDEETGKRAGVRTLIVGRDIDDVTGVLKQI